MRHLLMGAAAAALLGSALSAEAAPLRTRVYAPPGPMTSDEVRDFQMEQLERRHDMERESLRFQQRAERRTVDPEDDDDLD